MSRLLPEGDRPCKFAVLHHVLVSAPSTVHEYVKPAVLELRKCGGSFMVLCMVATDSNNAGRQICFFNAPSGSEYFESTSSQTDRDTAANTSAGTGNESCFHGVY